MKVGLVFLPAWIPYNPPLGISCIASSLKKENFDVTLFDYNAIMYQETKNQIGEMWLMGNAHYWETFNLFKAHIYPHTQKLYLRLVKEIIQKNIDVVGFSVYTSNSHPTRLVISLLKKLAPNVKIFYGGARIDKEFTKIDMDLRQVHAAVLGEGEQTTIELLNRWKVGNFSNDPLEGAILLGKDGEQIEAPSRKLLNIKELPVPDFSEYDLSMYSSSSLPIEFSRGCIAKCTFCSETNYWVSFRTKTPLQIFNEMKFQVQKYGVDEFRCVDSLMNGNHKLLEDLCDLIIKENLTVRWYGFCRIDKKLTPTLLHKMKKAGCQYINFGIESGSQNVLNLMKKQYTLEQIYKTVKDTHEAGISVHTQILIGFPGETWFNYFETLKMIFNLKNIWSRVYPGLPLIITERTHIIENLDLYNVELTNDVKWRTKNFSNTYLIRKIRHNFLQFFLKKLKISQGFPLELDPNEVI